MNRVWASCDVVIPKGEMAKAIRGLIARDVIAGQDKYTFTVDLQRLWVQKHRRLEWVKEEIADASRGWSSELTSGRWDLDNGPPRSLPPPSSQRVPVRLTALIVGLVLLLITGGGIVYYTTGLRANQLHVQAQQATATAVATLYPFSNHLVLDDPLSDNSKGNGWVERTIYDGSCLFVGGAYHARTASNTYLGEVCYAFFTNFSNFAYQVQMKIIKGYSGGVFFRGNSSSLAGYYFNVGQDGSYVFIVCSNNTCNASLLHGSSRAIKQGLNQTNLVTVVVQGTTIRLYVNQQEIGSVIDSTISQGEIGVSAYDVRIPSNTDVAFSNAKVWLL